MSGYLDLVKRLDGILNCADPWTSLADEDERTIKEAARAIESLLAEKASARDEAYRRAEEIAEDMANQCHDPAAAMMLVGPIIAAIRALRSPAKEKTDATA